MRQQLRRLLTLASDRQLDIDLHVDETNDVSRETLSHIAACVLEAGFRGIVTCGHCCSLALADDEGARATIALLREAKITVVTLPLANMHLQDRNADVTPRWRGVPPVKELLAAGVSVSLAGDNCRDAWFSYGDGDVVDTLRQGIRILHLDDQMESALSMIGPEPAKVCGFANVGVLTEGGPADLIVFEARRINHLLARPATPRSVIRAGSAVTTALPEYEELELVGGVKS